jgi:hypothetical protein
MGCGGEAPKVDDKAKDKPKAENKDDKAPKDVKADAKPAEEKK